MSKAQNNTLDWCDFVISTLVNWHGYMPPKQLTSETAFKSIQLYISSSTEASGRAGFFFYMFWKCETAKAVIVIFIYIFFFQCCPVLFLDSTFTSQES